MTTVTVAEGIAVNPEEVLEKHLLSLEDVGNDSCHSILVCPFRLQQYWLQDNSELQLFVFFEIEALKPKEKINLLITDNQTEVSSALAQVKKLDLNSLAKIVNSPVLSLQDCLNLATVEIPKPWGRELWYTGIEQRGVSSISDGTYEVPLPWVMAAAPKRLMGGRSSIVLLKVLDPLPDEVYGDLYFELHEKKQEVYVVTNIDENAWPDGVGKIRFGFNLDKLTEYQDAGKFLEAYRRAVEDYRLVRLEIDNQIDSMRVAQSVALDEPVSANKQKEWESLLSEALLENEAKLRSLMDDFTALRSLQVGDVVKVPLLTPHSLQHGVRTIEFQTPVYERKILSFAQKVLTQASWDTSEALASVEIDLPTASGFEIVVKDEYVLVEKIVDFDEFDVLRIKLSPGVTYAPDVSDGYAVLMMITGSIYVGKQRVADESAYLLSNNFDRNLRAEGDRDSVFLLASPK